jgi:hypothetical protein
MPILVIIDSRKLLGVSRCSLVAPPQRCGQVTNGYAAVPRRERTTIRTMAMGKRKRDRQLTMWVPATDLPTAASHPFYRRLNQLLRDTASTISSKRAWRSVFQEMTTLDATACQMWNLQMPTPGPLTTLMPTLNFACLTIWTVTLSIQTCWG